MPFVIFFTLIISGLIVNHFLLNEAFLFPRLVSLGIILMMTSCQSKPVCPPVVGTPQILKVKPSEQVPDPLSSVGSTPVEIEINNRWVKVDRLIEGSLCNDHLAGTVYVGCDVQVLEWIDQPLFLKDCDFSVEPGTVVYVADHNNASYYNGCSCHTGEDLANESISPN